MTITARQIRAIKVLQRQAGLDDDLYRDLLGSVAGKTSARQLTIVEGARVIDRLKALSKPTSTASRPAAATVSGPYGAKLRALWIAAWDLGVVHERDDRALLAFVERQTGLSHTRFLTEARDASKAIEGLKAWIAREAGVEWPIERGDVVGAKLAVLSAQLNRLAPFVTPGDEAMGRAVEAANGALMGSTFLDETQAELGRHLRKALATHHKGAAR